MKRGPRTAARFGLAALALATGLARVGASSTAETAVPGPGAVPKRTGEPDWAAEGRRSAELLSGYLRIDTTSPPGNELPGAEYLAAFLRGEGLAPKLLSASDTRGNVVVRLPATHPDPSAGGPILLLSHIDVVPADPRAWSFPPFSGAIENGFVYGRGALDDKGHGVAQAMALVLLQRSGLPRTRDVVLAATAGEETGDEDAIQYGVEWLAREHWEELGPPAVVWNEGGWSTPSALLGGAVVNAIASSEKRALWLTLVAEGQGGHGSRPRRTGANQSIVRAVSRIMAHETPLRVTPTVQESFARLAPHLDFPLSFVAGRLDNPLLLRIAGPELTRNVTMNALVRDTIAITGLQSFLKHNVIPRRAEAMLDVRLLPDSDAATFLTALRAVIDDPAIRIEGVPDPLPPVIEGSPWRNDLFEAMGAAMEEELPGSTTVPLLTTGGTDSKWLRLRGVPAYGFFPLLASDELLDTTHGLDERVPVSELERAVRVTYRTLLRMVVPRETPAAR